MMNEKTTNTNESYCQKNCSLSEWLNGLAFEMDKNCFPELTAKNVALINFIIKHDSNYRPLNDEGDDSISLTIENNYPNNIQKIVDEIDKSNSTHLASLGKGRKVSDTPLRKNGRIIAAEYIMGINDFEDRLAQRDLNLVSDIALHNYNYTISFASKYCTYMARALYKNDKERSDNYCIFDKVICDILPYYAWYYLGKDEYARLSKPRSNIEESPADYKVVSRIKDVFGTKESKQGYPGYCELIDNIRKKAKELSIDGYHISRKDFDHLLWYYFKVIIIRCAR